MTDKVYESHKDDVLAVLGERSVVLSPTLVMVTGDIPAALVLGQLLYWDGRQKDKVNGWIRKVAAELEEETCVTEKQQRRIRPLLVALGVIEFKMIGVPAMPHYRVVGEKIRKIIEKNIRERETANKVGPKVQASDAHLEDDKLVPKGHTNTEITSESTAESTNFVEEADPGPIPFSDPPPDPLTKVARDAGQGSGQSPRSAAAKKRAAEKFDIGVLEDSPAIKVHRDVCGYTPMTGEIARAIVSQVNGTAETTWRAELCWWMAQGYRPDNYEGELRYHRTEAKRVVARATQPAAAVIGQWKPARGMYPQLPDKPQPPPESRKPTRPRVETPDVVTIVDGVEVPF